jgi:hypothetical protein
MVEDVEWALEEYGICETDRYRIVESCSSILTEQR